jgi:thioredoxin reductase (NADPH)
MEVRYQTAVEAFEGQDSKLSTVRIRSLASGEVSDLHPAAAFVFIGQQPNTEFARGMLAMDPSGFILTGHDFGHLPGWKLARPPLAFETSLAGVFAAGDARHGSIKQVASAVGEGAGAAIAIREYLRSS